MRIYEINTHANPYYLTISDGAGGFATFANFAAFPDPTQNQGMFALASDTALLYGANAGAWWPIARLS